MMKIKINKVIVLGIIAGLVFCVNVALANSLEGRPFQVIWEVIEELKAKIVGLQEQIDGIELLPGPQGPPGPEGPRGEPGLPARHGAGNIAFMHEGDPAYLLKTDGTVWVTNTTSGWGGPLFTQIQGPVSQLPVPVSEIVSWEFYSFIDQDGNYWYFEYPTGANVWHNFGPIP